MDANAESAWPSTAGRVDRAWAEFCDRLKAIGLPGEEADRAEGYRHLARLVVFALQGELEFADRDFPAFHRYDDDVVKWGGPNADNHYQRAKVDPVGTYRLTGQVSGLRELIISTPEGDMALGRFRVFEERTLAELDVGTDGTLEVVIGPHEHPGNWIPLHPDADHVLVRQYQSDWDHDPVAPLRIERVDRAGSAPARPSPDGVATALDRAATWVEASTSFWSDYMERSRANGEANVLAPPMRPPGGARDIHYGGGWWDLDDDQALVIECAEPRARYWSFQLYSRWWFESLDIADRVTSLNGHQTHVDGDGRFRIVVSARDPGVQNWLDTEGRPTGMVSYRWVFTDDAPAPTASVVPVAAVRDHLPPDTPVFGSEDRATQIEARRAAIARRFRT